MAGVDPEPVESWSDSRMSCWLVVLGRFSRVLWSNLTLPTLMPSYNTARSRTTSTERAMPVKRPSGKLDFGR